MAVVPGMDTVLILATTDQEGAAESKIYRADVPDLSQNSEFDLTDITEDLFETEPGNKYFGLIKFRSDGRLIITAWESGVGHYIYYSKQKTIPAPTGGEAIKKTCSETEIDYCAVCSNNPQVKCSKCLPGYIKADPEGSACLKCPRACRKCAVLNPTTTTCLRCIRRFAWDYENNICKVAFGSNNGRYEEGESVEDPERRII